MIMKTETLLCILPGKIEHKILKYSFKDNIVAWSEKNEELELCIFKHQDTENDIYWHVGYFHTGWEGFDYALPIKENIIERSLESGVLPYENEEGVVDKDLNVALNKLYQWLCNENLIESYNF